MAYKFDPCALSEFARYHGFHYNYIDPINLAKDVLVDMERGLAGQSSSLLMIPTYISPAAHVTPGKTVIALDAGGTNLRAALVKFDENGKAVVGESLKASMPGSRGHISADHFFDEIAAVTAPLIEKSKEPVMGIGFCFSYSMEITKDADGILLVFSKEIDAPEVIGKAIGKGLKEALQRRKVKVPERVVLLNDTAATLLSGFSEIPVNGGLYTGADRYGAKAGPVIGLILGTGFNTAYPETRIPKIGFDSSNSQIVVCESGNFAHRYMGPLDHEYDKTTISPGAYTLEKAAAGGYLGPLTLHFLKQAIRDGVLKFKRSDEFLSWQTIQTRDLNAFLNEPLGMQGPIAALFDRDEIDAIAAMCYIASVVAERGALLSAAVVAGAVERTCGGYDPLSPVRIAVEGTTFMLYKGIRPAFESWLHIMLNKEKPRSYCVTPVEQASLFGAAVAALS
ncbi:MAG: hexokinase [Treponema sp.]|nr:hexokinase [Treponema sp.]